MSELRIASRLEAIDDARRWISQQLEEAGVGETDRWAVELAVTETLSNVIRHAYRGEQWHEIMLVAAFADGRLELRIVHWGEPLREDERSIPDFDGSAQGGYGLYLIDELMDEVHRCEAPNGGTQVTLVKSRWEA